MLKKWIGIFLLIAAIAFVVVPINVEPALEPEVHSADVMQADVVILRPAAADAVVTGFGQIRPRWKTNLSAEISGRVVWVSDSLLVGAQFTKDELLVQVDATAYQAAVAASRAALATAERALQEEQQRSKLAQDSWAASGLAGDASDLMLRRPHLAEAGAAVNAAQAALERAEYELQQTRIVAPYDGVVTRRSLGPNEVVQPGSQIAEIFDTSIFEVSVPLSTADIGRLGAAAGAKAHVSDAMGRNWSGHVVRVEPFVDAENRWINVIVQLDRSDRALSGQFVTVDLAGQRFASVLAVPETLISRRGDIWYLDADSRLRVLPAAPVFVTDKVFYIVPPNGDAQPLRVVVPRSEYLPGVTVIPNILPSDQPHGDIHAAKISGVTQ